ncbi:biotin--[acetyl-CoA-carboxylase] ligase [Helicobacter mustelae]|uniref:Putative biotin--[acetyl-CoA-carboxylase] synthetase n=1 Tax=Helicobacter mustelae (strain ATCC 43772 / CCUG 25715 / CIP 103759 / LMG 18044 / NCTC 12198 / R85-136P) TaxID=679897 RepID=D3UGR8_HELM1|nr:biotin--[acetyl-CoA-carboxylase] ligase [Helicobacter mustelae]CBG39689.1 putative biotin--[acetyl-CoA-carboxylase] synthetase [Helicobacter mustelae 12198]SQH71195.1 biotin--[acetyl-CoA-carboxylase] synthetase [Helicobacter mustelae]STP12322.1 biotin--[acetyl-CoA-carboxylase] synthetase [Helicobacter mustelae]
MKILVFEELDSTQKFLLENPQAETCVVALHQSAGVGSRGNAWQGVESGLYFSFCVEKKTLPKDLELQSASIFFGFLCKEVLEQRGFVVWLKWPNDLYLEERKIGGVIVNVKRGFVICGIGVNFLSQSFGALGVELERNGLLEEFFEKLKKPLQWKETFRKYRLEFHKNSSFYFHHKGKLQSLCDAELLHDGAISIHGEKIYGFR